MHRRRRDGFALATTMFALIVVGALVTGTWFTALHEFRAGTDHLVATRAFAAADYAVTETIASWDERWNGAYARGFGRTLRYVTPDGTTVEVRITRLSDFHYVVTAEARVHAATRAVGRLVRLAPPDIPSPMSALVVRDATLGALAAVDATDQPWKSGECAGGGPLLAPIAVEPDTSLIVRLGELSWSDLAARATVRPGVVAAGVAPRWTADECDIEEPFNWGEPMAAVFNACTSYFPLVHAPGDLLIDGGRGQGTLLVEGDLVMRGGFTFHGVVLVRGSVRVVGGGAHINGVMSIASASRSPTDLSGLTIRFSRCAVERALLQMARPRVIAEASWFARHAIDESD